MADVRIEREKLEADVVIVGAESEEKASPRTSLLPTTNRAYCHPERSEGSAVEA